MMKKLMLAMLIVLSLVSVPAMADESSNYEIQNIYIDGVGYSYDAAINVERGDEVTVKVYIEGTGETTDVSVKTWLGGYEYETVQETSEMFDVEDGVIYSVTLNLELPEDLDAEETYTLYVEAYDSTDSVTETTTIMVSKDRHLVTIQDVLVEDAEAGDYVSATVRLENMGDQKEEDIKVTVYNEELGIETSTYLDELTNEEIDNEDEESSGDVTLTFQLPEDADGDYTLEVLVEYNKGYDTTEESVSFHVDALEVADDSDDDDDSSVTVVVGDDEDGDEEEEETDYSTALRLGFGILAVLIVILALILIVRR